MTIDERLTILTERHEALTGHVELLTVDLHQLTVDVRELSSAVAKQRATMGDLMTGFVTLTEPAKSHDARIERLEGR